MTWIFSTGTPAYLKRTAISSARTPETSRLILKNFSDELAALTPKQAYLLLDMAAPVIKYLKENTTE